MWSDCYTLYDAPLTIVPLDTTLSATGGIAAAAVVLVLRARLAFALASG